MLTKIAMPTISLRIPQIGEGLQEARLVGFLKQPGEKVRRDEPIYQMETDKAVMDVESPYDGVLVNWLGKIDELLPIGGEVALLEVAADIAGATDAPLEPQAAAVAEEKGRAAIPPRTRAYAKEKGVSDADLAKLAESTTKLMPADIDAFLAGGGSAPQKNWEERPLSPKQRLLSSRLVRGSQSVVQGTMSVIVKWDPIERERERQKHGGDSFQPSIFTMFAFAVSRALQNHPDFRSTLVGEDTVRTYGSVSLGIAVGLPGDELVLAVVEDASALGWRDFAQQMREKIELARAGTDQAHEAVTISLTNMQAFGLHNAIPVVVAPSVATLFLGEAYFGQDPGCDEPRLLRLANVTLSFDHRLMNGVGAAKFLAAVKEAIETIGSILQ